MAALIAGMTGSYYVGGGETLPLSQNLEIWDWYDLDAVRDNLDGNHTLMNDLDSTTSGYEELASPTANGGKGWEPIGLREVIYVPGYGCSGPSEYVIWSGLTGTFDGQGYEIRDLFINRPNDGEVGLFCGVEDEGGIVDISVVNITVTGSVWVGGLVGANEGTVSNSYSTGNVTSNGRAGGLVGHNHGTLSNCHSTGNVIGYQYVGGLVGFNAATVSDSYSTGNVTGHSDVGGLVGTIGSSTGIVSNSYSTCNVIGDWKVGGLVGNNYHGTVSNSYSTGGVTGYSDVGGLVGRNYYFRTTVSDSFWDTETSGQSTSDGGTGKNTTEMKSIATFSGAAWNITIVGGPGTRNPACIWNIVNNVTYPFLSWEM